MSNQLSEEKLYKEARKIVEAKKGFYVHFVIFLIVSVVIYVVYRLTWTGYPWFIWPILGWGVGVLFHFLGIFFFSRQSEWDKRAIEREVERLKQQS